MYVITAGAGKTDHRDFRLQITRDVLYALMHAGLDVVFGSWVVTRYVSRLVQVTTSECDLNTLNKK